ncbi:MAG: hypothetical protein HY554_04800 [Elusimicrobia bacterium]|nr:hypothetical protein [Elusimicrobiota bacterium]
MNDYPEPQVNRREEDLERKGGAGIFASFLGKLGLGGSGAGASGLGVGGAGAGLSGGLLATKAGVVALVLAGTTVAAGIGVVGRGAMSGSRPSGGVSGAIYSLFPGKGAGGSAAGAGQAPASADGASGSLEYLAQAMKGDATLQEQPASADAAAAAEAPGQIAAPDHSNAPANVGSASLGGPRPQLAKMQGLSSQNAGGVSGSVGAPAAPGTVRTVSAAGVGGATSGLSRNPSAASGGRRAIAGARAVRPGDQLAMAARSSKQANASANPSMQRAGTTFDGSSAGIQASAAGVPAAATSGGVSEGERGRFSPNKVVDQRDVPQPAKVGDEKDVTAYKPYQYAAMAGLGVALVLMFIASNVKKTAAGMAAGPLSAAKYALAAKLYLAAAAAAAVALAMGVIIMTAYGQQSQGLMWTLSGGVLAGFCGWQAYKAFESGNEAEQAKEKAFKALEENHANAQRALDAELGKGQGADQGVVKALTAKRDGFATRLTGMKADRAVEAAAELAKAKPVPATRP